MNAKPIICMLALAGFLLAGCSTSNNPTPSSTTTPVQNFVNTSTGSPPATTTPAQPTSASPYTPPSSAVSLTGSGSTFVKPLVDVWATEYSKAYGNVHVGYNGGGSGTGRGNIRDKLVQYAGTDAPMSVAEQQAAPDILTIPDTIGPVNAVYNVDGVADGLHLTGDVLGQIYAGCVKMWDDNAIASLNPGVHLPHSTIVTVFRLDSSGTTFAFTDYLSKVSSCFSTRVTSTANSAPTWGEYTSHYPAQQGNDGVAAAVKGNGNTIGYVDLAWAEKLSLASASIQNAAGEWAAPTPAGAAAAANSVVSTLPAANADWSKVSIVNAQGSGVYPISSFSYILVYAKQSDYSGKCTPEQYAALKAWLHWDLHEGQDGFPDALGYAPLPAKVVAIGDAALAMMG